MTPTALSEPAWASALEVLVANDVTVLVDSADRYTPTPAVSHAILVANRGKVTGVDGMPAGAGLADGIVVTPSHNPPERRRLQVQPAPRWPGRLRRDEDIAARANELIRGGLEDVKRIPFSRARAGVQAYDFMGTYVDDLPSVVDLARSRTPASASAPTRSAAPPSTTGARSPTATASTSPSSTRSSTRPGAS